MVLGNCEHNPDDRKRRSTPQAPVRSRDVIIMCSWRRLQQ